MGLDVNFGLSSMEMEVLKYTFTFIVIKKTS